MMRWRSRGTERLGPGVPPWTREEHEGRYRFAASLIDGGVVIDCACGDGAGTVHYLRRHPKALLGFDSDPDAVAAARSSAVGAGADFEVADACALPVPDGTADLYISLETIEHVADPHALVREAARVLRPGARFICSTPNRSVQNPGASLEDAPLCAFHVREYTPRELLDILTPYFGTIEFHGQNLVSPLRSCFLKAAARLRSRRLAARLSQAAKLTRLVVDAPERHDVVPVQRGRCYDITVAVCSDPRAQADTGL